MVINFERVEIFTDVARTSCMIQNVKKEFADIIYRYGNGIEAHALALKIYNSNGNTEYSEDEVKLIRSVSKMLSPAFIDAIDKLTDD